MTGNNRIFYTGILCLLLWGCDLKSTSQDYTLSDAIETGSSMEGVTILDASFEDLDGNPIALSDFEGKRVFLNIWATWCKPCIREMPSISKAAEKLGEEVVFLAASDEKMERIIPFVEKYPFKFAYIRILDNVVKYNVQVLPTTYIIDEKGEIVFEEAGAREWDTPENLKLISGK